MRSSDWSSDVCSSDLRGPALGHRVGRAMNKPREARLQLPASPREPTAPALEQAMVSDIQRLATRHGISLTADISLLKLLGKTRLPAQLEPSTLAAIAVVVQHIHALSSPGGTNAGGN